ncbi:hypothetical protein SAMN06265827_12841 [Orenia metallireducens]|uniref:Uncharacterized protein n=1 Tax=Orenia metallireducens TaxID=1413210 RepID=A0A285I366_9FIRM|nr:hypothetical protein [Orenia metallireducens]SNY41391.1 hypothetical protein SAMN06265827_12841 [Orenia metallireducens]
MIILGLSSWLGNIWSKRILEYERQIHRNEIEELKHINKEKIDIIIRRRKIYQEVATNMRVFLSGDPRSTEEEKKNFLQAYDSCYLWGSDEVLKVIGEFLDLNIKNTDSPNINNQSKLQELYCKCLIEMRRDSGFQDTSLEIDSYKIVNFLD